MSEKNLKIYLKRTHNSKTMNIYINIDTFKTMALKTEKYLTETCGELNINIVEDIDKADIICSIGGDGTFLKSARLSEGKLILGINCGTMGFLTEIEPENIDKALKEVMNGNFYIDKRMMLEGEIIKENGDVINIPPALNEIAISKNIYGVVRFNVIVNGKLINSYTADGMIVSTPTGSTAYNLSCGGPIVDPTAEIITLTPIAPHTILNRSIILSDDSIIEIEIIEFRGDADSFVLYDGNAIKISVGDVVKIKKSEDITKIIKLDWKSFIDVIHDNIN